MCKIGDKYINNILCTSNEKIVKIKNIDNIKEYLFQENNNAYRGLQHDFHLFPTILREFERNNGNNYNQFSQYEKKMYNDYNRYSIQYLPYYENLLDWLASGQHFGLPTRLLDWTYNPLVALYFALGKETKGDVYIFESKVDYCIDDLFYFRGTTDWDDTFPFQKKWLLEKNLEWIDNEEKSNLNSNSPHNICDAKKFYTECKENKKICFVKSNNANPRIIAQDGLFQLCRFPKNKFESLDVIKQYLVSQIKTNILRIYIIKESALHIVKTFLNEHKIITPKLFPDLASICNYIKESNIILTRTNK